MAFNLEFTVPGDPKSKGRPRFTRYGKPYTDKDTKAAELAIAAVAQELCPAPYTGRCGIEVTFYTKTMRRVDLDNLQKLVMDALNEVVYTDDYLIEEIRCRLFRKKPGEEPRTEVFVYDLPDDE